MNVLGDNATHITSGVIGWILTIFGIGPVGFHLDPGDLSVDGLLKKAALTLACIVSLGTLLKIRREINALKKDEWIKD